MFPLNTAGRIGLNVLLFLAGTLALHLGQMVIVPMLIALILATVLGPAAEWLHTRLKINWTLSCISVMFGLVLVTLLITAVFSTSVTVLVSRLTEADEC